MRLEKSAGSIRDRLAQYVASEYKDTSENPIRVRLIFRMIFSPEEGYPFFNYVEEFHRERNIIAECIQKSGDTRERNIDAEMTSTALMGTMLIQILEFLFTGKQTLTRRNAKKLINLHLPYSKH